MPLEVISSFALGLTTTRSPSGVSMLVMCCASFQSKRRTVHTRGACAGEQWPQLPLVGQVVECAGAYRKRHAGGTAPGDPVDRYGHPAQARFVRCDQLTDPLC